jgi:hypothetical protein|tara:strand:+ start:507 stop:824 length:318 start_codon:yes stop_codon:yes gene_type:complete
MVNSELYERKNKGNPEPKALDPEDSDSVNNYFSQLRLTFLTEGWHLFIEELRLEGEGLDTLLQCKDAKDLHFRQGQLSVIDNILNLESTLEISEENLQEAPYESP